MILVDTNVLLDVLQDDPKWADWSQGHLEACSLQYRLAINPVIYSELSIAFKRIEQLEKVIADMALIVDVIPREALFLAGKVFLSYRRRQGTKQGVLPDFYIGAHAAIMNYPILTRDTGRFRSYFPSVQLVAPSRAAYS